jgi:hypothetical protein
MLRRLCVSAIRTYGPKGLGRRVAYESLSKTGIVRLRERRPSQCPWPGMHPDARIDLAVLQSALQHLAAPEAECGGVATSKSLVGGTYSLYGGAETPIGWPPDWHLDPTTGRRYRSDRHWSKTSDDSLSISDVKDVWELSRLSFLGPLLRAYVTSGDSQWVERIWEATCSWWKENPPFLGVNWMNGQEVAIRGIAVMHALTVISDEAASTEARLEIAGSMLGHSASRVWATLGYARSQRNNHIITEAAFLWTFAALSPGLRGRDRLLRKATRVLEESIDDQFGADGSYAQHSFNYQRLALHALLWVEWVVGVTQLDPPIDLATPIRNSLRLMTALLDQRSGWLPNLGGNDGALLFRLSDTEHRDMRPLLVHAALRIGEPPAIPAGPWDEEALWFGLFPDADRVQDSLAVPNQGSSFHVLRGPDSHGLLRSGPLRHRLAHADQLHIDLWIGGCNVARDAGTYRYTAPPPWQNALAAEGAHNVPLVPGRPQAQRLGRFFWLDWPEPEVLFRAGDGGREVVLVELVLPGRPRVAMRRVVARFADRYLVADYVPHRDAVVRWHLPDQTMTEVVGDRLRATGSGFSALFVGSPTIRTSLPDHLEPLSAWESPTYADLQPIVTVTVPVEPGGHAFAEFAPGDRLLLPEAASDWRDALIDPSAQTIARALADSVARLTPEGDDVQ